ncbi:MAG: hypothetical protein NC419_08620 [Muribaculaceae bacterium]|nr:hypothetical protein [Muribaculaceae bacterium]
MDNSEKLDVILMEIKDMKEEIQELKMKNAQMGIILENEIRVNIQRVAEGHLDLSRSLNKCVRLSNEVKNSQVVQDIYINKHEAKLKAI